MKCRADLRVCLNCVSYDPRVAQQCRERRAEPVLEKVAERHRILMAAKRVGAHLLPSQELLVAEFSPVRLEEYFDRGAGACPRPGRAQLSGR